MARRVLSETGYYHVTTRTAGQIAMFEDDNDRRRYLRLLKAARDKTAVRILAWVLMTDHVHLVLDCGEEPAKISEFMFLVDSPYTRYFNLKTGRSGTLFQGDFKSKPITNEAQLIATIHYVHMNPESAGIAPMRTYHWSSWQEYSGTKWVVDTSTVLAVFGGFEGLNAYQGSPKDVVKIPMGKLPQDGDVLADALQLAGVQTSDELRSLDKDRRNVLIHQLHERGVSARKIARTFGIGVATVSRILS